MRSVLVLAILILAVVHWSMAAPPNDRGPNQKNDARGEQGQNNGGRGQGKGKKPTKAPKKGMDKEGKDKLRANCQKKANKCKGQTEEYKKSRQNVKSVLTRDFKTRYPGQDAEKKAEAHLSKIQELKRKLNAKYNLTDIEPADDGFWQKDIILTEGQIDQLIKRIDNPRQIPLTPEDVKQKRSSAWYFEEYPDYRWKMPIHYWVDSAFNSTEQEWIDSAISTISRVTGCIQFVKDTTRLTTGSQMQYSKPDSCCCWGTSYIGYIGINPIDIAVGCSATIFKGRVFHETIHALGGGHEQSRTDRDYHIDVLWENIDPQSWSQYDINEWSTSYGVLYDYRSVMHYEQGGFALAWNLDTMRPFEEAALGNDFMTPNDILQLKRMYCRPSSCVDQYQDCGFWATFDWCADADRGPWMRQFCPRSCGAC